MQNAFSILDEGIQKSEIHIFTYHNLLTNAFSRSNNITTNTFSTSIH